MDRRKLLTCIGTGAIVAASGCLGGVVGGGPDRSPPMTLSLQAVDGASGPLSYEVTVSNDRLDATEVPVLEIAVTNTGDETASWSYAGQVSDLPFQQGRLDSTGRFVIGLREEVRAQLLDASDGCSRVDGFERADGIKSTTLESGERIGRSYAIAGVDGKPGGDCPAPGEYRMEHDLGEYGTWGFDFQVE